MKRFLSILFLVLFSLSVAAQVNSVRSNSKVVVGGVYYYVHTVQQGETLYSLSRLYDVGEKSITDNNPSVSEGLKAGSVVKIPVSQRVIENEQKNIIGRKANNRTTTKHKVNKGETAYSISKRYAITIDDMIRANPGLDPLNIKAGQEIIIPKSVMGSVTQSEAAKSFTQYAETVSEIDPAFDYYLVEAGETLFSISNKKSVSIDTIRKYNAAELTDGLKFGTMLKLPSGNKPVAAPETPEDGEAEEGEKRGDTWIPDVFYTGNSRVKDFNLQEPLTVTVMMPFTVKGRPEQNFIDLYNGMLIALEEIKESGISLNVNVYDTKRDLEEINSILSRKEVAGSDIIIGPVYDNEFRDVALFAEEKGVPMVSPLGNVSTGNNFIYQITPSPEYKYNKIRDVFIGDKNVVMVIPNTGVDSNFRSEISEYLPELVKRVDYTKALGSMAFNNVLSKDKENIIVIPTVNENITDDILARLSSIQMTASARTGKAYPMTVIGSPRWARFDDKKLFFELNVSYLANYHADRSDARVSDFAAKYIGTFSVLPNSYAYRGYDIAKLFIPAIYNHGGRYPEYLGRTDREILQVPYSFKRDSTGKWVNSEWAVVSYKPYFTIETK